MSLSVPSPVHEIARNGGTVSPKIFLDIVRQSLPAAWQLCEELSAKFGELSRQRSGRSYVTVRIAHLTDVERGQVLRAFASTSIRRELGRFFEHDFFLLNRDAAVATSPGDAERVVQCIEGLTQASDPKCFIARLKRDYPEGSAILRQVAKDVAENDRFACHAPRSMDTPTRIQLLELHAILPIRLAFQEELGVEFAFQNCHATSGDKKGKGRISKELEQFSSIEAQILNQSVDLVDC